MHDAGYVTAKDRLRLQAVVMQLMLVVQIFQSWQELEIRKHIEEEMAKTLKTMHPVNYLDVAWQLILLLLT